jgi:hypothetical protein
MFENLMLTARIRDPAAFEYVSHARSPTGTEEDMEEYQCTMEKKHSYNGQLSLYNGDVHIS